MLKSNLKLLASYATSRILRLRVLGLIVLILIFYVLLCFPQSAGQFLVAVSLLCLVVLQLRIRDDIADREYDAKHHPERVLSRLVEQKGKIFSFYVVLIALVVLNSALFYFLRTPSLFFLYIGLTVAFEVGYAWLRWKSPSRSTRTYLILLKYPVILCLLSLPGNTLDLLLSATALYVLLLIIEFRSDPALRRAPKACVLLQISII